MPKSKTNHIVAGTIIGSRYEVLDIIHVGLLSSFYLARHTLSAKKVVLKILTEPIALNHFARFQSEIRCLTQIMSPNVVSCCDANIAPGERIFSAMNFIEGENFSEVLAHTRITNISRFQQLFGQACNALSSVHECKFVHRNVNPTNFILSNAGTATESLTLLGFTYTQALQYSFRDSDELDTAGEIIGDAAYISPEQCLGLRADVRSDIYSLGCCMFAALTGYPPFQGLDPTETMRMHIAQKPQLKLDNKPEFRHIRNVVNKCLEKDPNCRYQSIADLKKALGGPAFFTKPSIFLQSIW